MNILPKKRWHVRTKDNIARVRRDEANAAEEEKERLRRAKLAEQEARTALLRGRSTGSNLEEKKKDTSDDSKTTADIYTAEGNINFFKQLETGGGMCNGISNKEHEKEEKDEKEKYEKKIGLLTYLGQDTIEATNGKEWYHDNSKCVSALLTAKQDPNEENVELGLKSKRNLDPLKDILKYTTVKKKDVKDSQRIDINAPVEMILPSEKKIRKLKKLMKRNERKNDKCKRKMKSSHKEKKCKRKRHVSESDSDDRKSRHYDKNKRRKKSKRRADSSSFSSSSESDSKEEQRKKMNEMRKKRLAREEEEKRRTQTFLAGNVSKPDPPPVRQKYNSQFNPSLAKQNKS